MYMLLMEEVLLERISERSLFHLYVYIFVCILSGTWGLVGGEWIRVPLAWPRRGRLYLLNLDP